MDDMYISKEPLIRILRSIIRTAVRALAILMTIIILWGVADVAWVLYKKLKAPPFMMLTISDILALFGALMAVLIAIEIFINIIIGLIEFGGAWQTDRIDEDKSDLALTTVELTMEVKAYCARVQK